MEIRVRLKHRRLARIIRSSKLSQNRWAQKLGIERGHFSKLLQGQRPYPEVETRLRLLEGLNLSFDDLFEYQAYDPDDRPQPRLRSSGAARRFGLGTVPSNVAVEGRESRFASFFKDLADALRRLRGNPGYCLVAVLTLSVGIGANSAIYTLLRNTLMAPLPFRDPRSLVVMWSHARDQNWLRGAVSIPEAEDQRRGNPALAVIGNFNSARSLSLTSSSGAERLDTVWADSGYFRALGVQAAIGRTFSEDEDRGLDAHPVVILSHHFWRDRQLPSFASLSLDLEVVGLSILVSLATGLLFGSLPALHRARVDPGRTLHSTGRSARGGARVLGWLVAAEAALAVVLLVGAGLTAKSFYHFVRTEMGFDSHRLLTLRTELRGPGYSSGKEIQNFVGELLREVRALPDVETAAVWGPNMVGQASWHINLTPEGRDAADERNWVFAQRLLMTPGALETLSIPLLRGRSFTPHDRDSAQDRNGDGQITPDEVQGLAVMVDQRLAEILWPGEEALGKRVQLWASAAWPATVVGVTQTALHRGRGYSGSDIGDIYLRGGAAGLGCLGCLLAPCPLGQPSRSDEGAEGGIGERGRDRRGRREKTLRALR